MVPPNDVQAHGQQRKLALLLRDIQAESLTQENNLGSKEEVKKFQLDLERGSKGESLEVI